MVRIGARVVALAAVVVLVAASVVSAAGVPLPDGRAFELVSPVAKNGVEVVPQTDKKHVRPDGNAVTFSALGGFGPVEGSSFDFEYMSRRTGLPGTSGWSTHGINPLARPVTFDGATTGNSSTFVNGFTSDLSVGIYQAWQPLVDAPNAADVTNLYRVAGLDGGARTVQLMSDSVNPIPPGWFSILNGLFVRRIQPRFAGVSSDLTHVVFESELQLTADAPAYPAGFCSLAGFLCPTHLYENADGVVRLVGRIPQAPDITCDDAVGPACVAAESSQAGLGATQRHYSQFAVGRDGRRIVFQVPAGADSGALYLREDGVRTEQIAANGQFWTASDDATRTFFITSDTLVAADTDGSPDVYMYDRSAPAGSRYTLISTGSTGIDGYAESVVGASADGHTLYFVFDGQLIAGEAEAGLAGLYRWHDGALRFIGSFPNVLVASVNGPRRDWALVVSAMRSRVSSDGEHLLFATLSDAGFVDRGGFRGYDHAAHWEFYLYDATTGRLVCASCNPRARAASSDAVLDVRDNAATSQSTSDSAQALSDDGRRVFFNTEESLVEGDVNGRFDPYEYDALTGRVYLLASGTSTSPSYFVDASPSGDDVFIVTRERLVGWDVDGSYDMYDVRVGGGFPEPVVRLPGCVGEGCRGQGGVVPSVVPLASLESRGAGDRAGRLRRRRRCGHRRVLRRVRGKRRCVRRRAHRRAKRALVAVERSGR